MTEDTVRRTVLADPEELRRLLAAGREVCVLDVRWALGRTDGAAQHRAGHVPGAVYVDLDTELAAPATTRDGRHPLPAVVDLQAAARRWGVRAGVPVVAYDAVGGMSAARAWWLLRWCGVADVRILDGGLDAWAAAGGALEAGDVAPEPGDVVLSAGGLEVLGPDDVAALAAEVRQDRVARVSRGPVLLDARAGERFRGEAEPVDPRAGHIPGATSAPTAGNLDGGGRFLDPETLRERFARLGAVPDARVAVYCGSG
ncbi:MAG TPA: rhodanese-like domain-containing protein, partial [Cellulomonadaceae bacterium]|nr:rhodanese-like domain-containing protein [Cellulomonadaceae bacterium]